MSIQIGVLVRPFNTREKNNNSICVIEMNLIKLFMFKID